MFITRIHSFIHKVMYKKEPKIIETGPLTKKRRRAVRALSFILMCALICFPLTMTITGNAFDGSTLNNSEANDLLEAIKDTYPEPNGEADDSESDPLNYYANLYVYNILKTGGYTGEMFRTASQVVPDYYICSSTVSAAKDVPRMPNGGKWYNRNIRPDPCISIGGNNYIADVTGALNDEKGPNDGNCGFTDLGEYQTKQILTNDQTKALVTCWKKAFASEASILGVQNGSTIKTVTYSNRPDNYKEWGSYTGEADAWGNMLWEQDEYVNKGTNDSTTAATKVTILTWTGTNPDDANSKGIMGLYLNAITSQLTQNGKSLMTYLSGLAMSLVVAFSILKLMQLSQDRALSSEAVSRELAKMLFAIWFMCNYTFFAEFIIYFGSGLINMLTVTLEKNASNSQNIKLALIKSYYGIVNTYNLTDLTSDSVTAGVATGGGSNWFDNFISGIGDKFVQMASSFTIYMVAIQIGVRYIMTPFAIADLFSEQFRSPGIRWLKTLLAWALTGLIIFLIIYCCNIFKQTLGSSDLITNTVINLTMLGMFAGANGIAKEVVGV